MTNYPHHANITFRDGRTETYPRWGNSDRFAVVGQDHTGVREGEPDTVAVWCSGSKLDALGEADRWQRRYGGDYYVLPVSYE